MRFSLTALAALLAVGGCAASRLDPTPRPDTGLPERAAERLERTAADRGDRPAVAAWPERALGPPNAAALASPALVRPLDPPAVPTQGLAGRHLALWASHGWYYEASLDRWEWQRARLFTTVEDLLTASIVTPYLAPMFERAGAVVLTPRERDPQRHEAVVDDAHPAGGAISETGAWTDDPAPAYGHRPVLRDADAPFQSGRARLAATVAGAPTATATFTPTLPEAGDYAVTLAWTSAPDRAADARVDVHHEGGVARFAVNQTMGGGTWVPLGTFRFAPGRARVVVTNESGTAGRTVSADAVRWGGGTGSVERGGRTSGRARYVEAARYWMQFAGAPPHVWRVSEFAETAADRARAGDYRDDFQGRGEWANWLAGTLAPPPSAGRGGTPTGLGIPVDAAIALHTDAGTTRNDTTVGTLMIVHSGGFDGSGRFPDGRSRRDNLDFGRLVLDQIVSDLRALHDPAWASRGLRDRNYSEAARPNVPSVLIELLAHQNDTDMRFALDPRVRFDAARAIYKATGRFLAARDGTRFVPQPLAPDHLEARLLPEGGVRVRWLPVADPLEPLAEADAFVLQTRRGDGGWDAGVLVAGTEAVLPEPPAGEVLSVRVAAVNRGGQSAPSEALAVGRAPGDGGPPALVVAAFDRVAAPAHVADGDLRGFLAQTDRGVPDGVEIAFTGDQVEFDARVPWRDDDDPGHGASEADFEGTLVAGNDRDVAAVHGRALLAAGRSFGSASDEAVESGRVALADAPVVSLALGLERATPPPAPGGRSPRGADFAALPPPMRAVLADYLGGGGALVLSGAHWATDTAGPPPGSPDARPEDDAGVVFLRDVLGVRWRTGHAATDGRAEAVRPGGRLPPLLAPGTPVAFRARRGPAGYAVEAPDGVEPADPSAQTLLRYPETNVSAAVGRRGPTRVVALGFPLEAVDDAAARAGLLRAALDFLER